MMKDNWNWRYVPCQFQHWRQRRCSTDNLTREVYKVGRAPPSQKSQNPTEAIVNNMHKKDKIWYILWKHIDAKATWRVSQW